jgi:hypothetical protein
MTKPDSVYEANRVSGMERAGNGQKRVQNPRAEGERAEEKNQSSIEHRFVLM